MAENGKIPNGDLYFSCIRLIEGPRSFSFLATEQRLVHRLIDWEFKNRGRWRVLWDPLGQALVGALGSIGLNSSEGPSLKIT